MLKFNRKRLLLMILSNKSMYLNLRSIKGKVLTWKIWETKLIDWLKKKYLLTIK